MSTTTNLNLSLPAAAGFPAASARRETTVAGMGRPGGPAVLPEVPNTGTDVISREKQGVLEVLQQYKQAYERLDVKAAQAVWPSVDRRELEKKFRDLNGQELRFDDCRVTLSVSGPNANATCHGEATFHPKFGKGSFKKGEEWTFTLSRHEERWQIVNQDLQ